MAAAAIERSNDATRCELIFFWGEEIYCVLDGPHNRLRTPIDCRPTLRVSRNVGSCAGFRMLDFSPSKWWRDDDFLGNVPISVLILVSVGIWNLVDVESLHNNVLTFSNLILVGPE